ncbi:hypothetical protein FE782_31330 [Paenibacillus antri]|uniref:Uncharacterized protein n=1 Tax=Paenibacillus antri TaxID=2582848 RepID=A0A5R9G5T6_9BACL|nr:endospore germination permease [Paenibacillus antri]TLS48324.1 hypothetical protein FE782_31330 [Paenibacillus antri]
MNNNLSRSQVLMIGCAFVLDSTLISKPSLVIRDLESDFWAGFLPAFGYGLAAVALFAMLASRFPRKDLFDGLIAASPFWGRLVVAICVLFFFGVLVRDTRATTDFVKVSLLTVTPITVIAVCLAFCLVAAARHGKLSVARMSQLWQPMLILLVLLLPVFLSSTLALGNLLPVFQHTPLQVFEGGSHLYSYMGEAVGTFMIAKYRTWTTKFSLFSLALGWFLLLVLTFSVVMTLGVEIPMRTFYPNYEMIRKVRLTDFLDRLDLPMIGIWLPAMVVKASFGLYIVANGIARIVPKWKLGLVATAAMAAALAIALYGFRNALQIFDFDRYWTPVSASFHLGLPALLLMLFRKRKKPPTKSAAEAEQEAM